MLEWIKLTLFVLGLICLGMSVAVSAYCLVPTWIFWGNLHILNWFLEGYEDV